MTSQLRHRLVPVSRDRTTLLSPLRNKTAHTLLFTVLHEKFPFVPTPVDKGFSKMMSFLRGQRGNDAEREPLLPRHSHDTALQTSVDKKLESYAILKALSKGYLPSNEQIISHLRRNAAALDAVPRDISGPGRALTRDAKHLLEDIINLLRNKNGADQIQDFACCISQARLDVDTEDIRERVQSARPRADVAAGKPPKAAEADFTNRHQSIHKPIDGGVLGPYQLRVSRVPRRPYHHWPGGLSRCGLQSVGRVQGSREGGRSI